MSSSEVSILEKEATLNSNPMRLHLLTYPDSKKCKWVYITFFIDWNMNLLITLVCTKVTRFLLHMLVDLTWLISLIANLMNRFVSMRQTSMSTSTHHLTMLSQKHRHCVLQSQLKKKKSKLKSKNKLRRLAKLGPDLMARHLPKLKNSYLLRMCRIRKQRRI